MDSAPADRLNLNRFEKVALAVLILLLIASIITICVLAITTSPAAQQAGAF
jgi:hypothetical protein